MAKLQAVCKNSFLSFVDDPADDTDGSFMSTTKLHHRSRSADIPRCRPEPDCDEFSKMCLVRLNTMLSVGTSEPQQSPSHPDTTELSPVDQNSSGCEDKALSELLALQGKLAMALAVTPASKQKFDDSSTTANSMTSGASDCGDSSGTFSVDSLMELGRTHSVGNGSDTSDNMTEVDDSEYEFMVESLKDGRYTSTHKVDPITTMMIQNFPCHYTPRDFMMDLEDSGFGGAYDFLCMPMDDALAANVGYAIVNFVCPMVAQKFMEIFEAFNYTQEHDSEPRLANVSIPRLQGLSENLQHYHSAAPFGQH